MSLYFSGLENLIKCWSLKDRWSLIEEYLKLFMGEIAHLIVSWGFVSQKVGLGLKLQRLLIILVYFEGFGVVSIIRSFIKVFKLLQALKEFTGLRTLK